MDSETIAGIEQNILQSAYTYYSVYEKLGVLNKRTSGSYQKHLNKIYTIAKKRMYEPGYNFWHTGHSYRSNKDYANAFISFMEGLLYASDNPYLYRITGEVFLTQDKLDDALATLQYSKAICPENIKVGVLYQIANVYKERGDYAKAIDMYKEAVEVEPTNPVIFHHLAWAI